MAHNFLMSTLTFVDTLMIGQLNESAIVAVGIANQFTFFFLIIQFGVHSGISIYTAQYWGRKDIRHIRKLVGISLQLGICFGILFTLLALVFPAQIIVLFSKDPAVIAKGVVYLRIVGLSYPANVITFAYTYSLRSTEQVIPPLITGAVAVVSNIILNYLLIFGKLGLPALGVTGAAVGTCIARCLECLLILLFTYIKQYPSAAQWRYLWRVERTFFARVLKTAWPVIFHEFTWVLGFSIYNLIYARLGTNAFAAVNICVSIEGLALLLFMSISHATAIMVGNCIGAEKEKEAYISAVKLMVIQVSLAFAMGLMIIFGREPLLSFYNIAPVTHTYAYYMLFVMGLILWGKVSNVGLIIGTFRSGGDTRFGLFLDLSGVWLVGIPMGLLGAFVLNLPVYWVMAMVVTEEIYKISLGMPRFFSRKWIRNLVSHSGTSSII
ncbi:MAG: MATE family efflux transporter [Desulfobacteraceae bacterium]